MSKWHEIVATATALSESGHLVTQLHCTDSDIPDEWSYLDYSTTVHRAAKVDMVVTTDGRCFAADGEEIGGDQ